MTQQNETQQQGAAAPGPPEQRAPARPELAGPEPHGTSGQAGTPQPGMRSQLFAAQQAASAAPASTAPSPPLYGYESLPEAYLAPPQLGQPRYGTLPQPGGGRPFAGRPGYGESGSGQPTPGRPGDGRPAPSRPALGVPAQRDPALASLWRRLAAQTIDWLLIFAVAQAVFWSQLSLINRELQAATGRYPDLATPAARAAFNSLRSSASFEHALLFWFLGMFGIALAYYWVLPAVWGATVGKWAMGMRVVRASDRSRPGVLMTGMRAAVFLFGPAVFLLLTLLISPVNVVGGILWATDNGLPLLDSQAQSLHDKVAGTVVVRQRALKEGARRSGSW